MSKINIIITDEFEESEQKLTGKLDLETGEISDILQTSPKSRKPWTADDYSFSSGLLKVGNKELEFAVNADKNDGYSVSFGEIEEIKQKMASLVSIKPAPKRKKM